MKLEPLLPPSPELLAAVSRKWQRLAAVHRAVAPPPWWSPGLVIGPDVRRLYERFLPLDEWLGDVRRLLARLPHPLWEPRTLRHCPWASLPDLWEELPPTLAGKLVLATDDLLPLACALASPGTFGSRAGRYPEQRKLLADHAGRLPAGALVVDLGCGTGQGTWELASWLTASHVLALGVTREPLEAWMARERRLPHHGEPPPAEWAFPELTGGGTCHFVAGDLYSVALARPADLVVCNGLIGGPALHEAAALAAVTARLAKLVAPGGLLLYGDRFHAGWDGARRHVAELLAPQFAELSQAGASRLWERRQAPQS